MALPRRPNQPTSILCNNSVVDGIMYRPGTTKEWLQDIKSLPGEGEDVFVTAYPKSGSSWISEVVWQICMDGKIDVKSIDKRVPFIEGLKIYENITTKEQLQEFFINHPYPRIFKTHLRYDKVPIGDSVTTRPKYINVIRNPKDCAVSFFHHMRGFRWIEFDAQWDDFFEMFIEGNVIHGCWFDHVLGWWDHRDDPNILTLKYEDMKKDLPSAVQRIATFICKDLSLEMIQKIAEQTTFEVMSERPFYDEKECVKYRIQGNHKFLRKGEVGDWRNYFTEEQNRRFDELYDKKMAGSGLELTF